MKPKTSHPLSIGLATLLLASGPTSAALVSISSANLSGNGSQILTTGVSLVFAWHTNGNAVTAPVVNGITFSNSGSPALLTLGGSWPATIQDDAALSSFYSGGMAEIMGDYIGTNTNANGTITLNGLTVGDEYRVQFLHHQDVNNDGIRQMEVRFGGASGTSTGSFAVGNNQGRITTAIFTADATTQTFTFDPGADDRAILNGAVLYKTVPEPATTLFGSLGMLCLLRRRR